MSMADILTFSRKGAVTTPQSPPPLPDMNRRRLEGLKFIEELKTSTDAAADREMMIQYETDKITFMMRRALDYIPPSLLRDLADEIATEYELRGR